MDGAAVADKCRQVRLEEGATEGAVRLRGTRARASWATCARCNGLCAALGQCVSGRCKACMHSNVAMHCVLSFILSDLLTVDAGQPHVCMYAPAYSCRTVSVVVPRS